MGAHQESTTTALTVATVSIYDDPDDETDARPIHGRQDLLNLRHLSEGVHTVSRPNLPDAQLRGRPLFFGFVSMRCGWTGLL